MLADVIDLLVCPHCAADLRIEGTSLRCDGGHSFDVAKQGYVNLLPGGHAGLAGDSADMVAARAEFLGAGHYRPIVDAVVDRVGDGPVADLGAGLGHYLAPVLGEHRGLALDLSKHALRRAARAHPRIGAVVCDAWQDLPVRTGSIAVLLNVFAPRNPAQMHRILRPGGTLVVVSPTARHLAELVRDLGLLRVDEDKQDRIDRQLAPWFEPTATQAVEFAMTLSAHDVATVVGMGPSAWHTDGDELRARITAPAAVTASVSVTSYRRSG